MNTLFMSFNSFVIFLFLCFSSSVFAHNGSHGNDDCYVMLGEIELRFNGYQFQGSQPDRHYCRHFPYLGETIIKLDSVTTDLSDMSIEMQLLKRNSWLDLIFNPEQAFSVIKQSDLQHFSKQVVSISRDIQARDVYAVKLRLHHVDGKVVEQQFMFMIGFPFAHIMVAIAVLLLFFIAFVFLRSLWLKGKQ